MLRRLLKIYLVLLLASHAVRLFAPHDPREPNIAIDELSPERKTTVVLLHGSPMGASDWQPLAEHLAEEHRVVIPHLYGSGRSSRQLDDFSPRAAAGRLAAVLQDISADGAHLVGYSTGGTTALYLAAGHPDLVASLTLLSPMAIEQLELVGDGTLNHTVYWAQKFYIWCGLELVPHFGLLDDKPIGRTYGKHYYDSDLRELAPLLDQVAAPAQIVHGANDLVRPAASSKELARRLPHAELTLLEGGHGAPLADTDALAAKVRAMIRRPTPTRAPGEVASEPFGYDRYKDDLRTRVALMVLLLAVATLISEDITCITAGILAARGMLGFFPATLGCFLGILIGDTGLYLLGRVMGRGALRAPPLKWMVKEEQIDTSEKFFARYGPLLVIVTRWLPGMRIPTYVAAGMLKLPFRVFFLYFFIAAAIWTPLLVGLSTLVGNTLLGWLAKVEDYAPLVLLGVLVTVWLAAKVVVARLGQKVEGKMGGA